MAIKIAWNDGHTLSGKGTGAVGLIKETDRNREIGRLVRQILTEEYEGVTIINCTIDKSDNDMLEAVTIANNSEADVFISNHVNAGGGVGFETFYSRYSTQANINHAKIIHKHLVHTTSCLLNRRCMADYDYKGFDLFVLANTKMEAILCEIGFVDNAVDVARVDNKEVARAFAEGIAEAYNIKKKEVVLLEGIILYKGELDGYLAQWLGWHLGYPVAKNTTKVDLNLYKNVICIGYSASDYPRCTKLISGANRKGTLQALINYI